MMEIPEPVTRKRSVIAATTLVALCGVVLAAAIGGAVLIGANRHIKSTGSNLPSPKLGATQNIVAELFTSEGCSSCPPADDLLSQLAKNQPVEGAHVIVLSEHVDYWNQLGWKDPFSSAQFSERQSGYMHRFNASEVYTPQLVVGGSFQGLGSDPESADANIRATLQRRESPVGLVANRVSDRRVSIEIKVNQPTADADMWIAVTEDGLRSAVTRGENAGRRLTHVGVVRSLKSVAKLEAGVPFGNSYTIDLNDAWDVRKVKIVAFVQQPNLGSIDGAAEIALPLQ